MSAAQMAPMHSGSEAEQNNRTADYVLHIAATPVEIAPKKIISAVTYNGLFPGPLLRFKEGRQVTVDVFNDTDTPEQLHWHGQLISTSVDGAAEEARRSFPLMESVASFSRPVPQVSAFITHTIARVRISPMGSIAVRSGLSTSNRSMIRADMTARSSWF